MENPTIVVITDRNDLDGQSFGVFSLAQDLLREQPVQAGTRQELRTLLGNRPSGGIVFATIQKFMPGEDEDAFPLLSDRSNIVVIADEAHRTQYGFEAKLKTLKQRAAVSVPATVLTTGTGQPAPHKAEFAPTVDRYQVGYAQHLRDALPHATFVAFTGTPVSGEDRDTRAVFGDYISVYDMQQAKEDGATVAMLTDVVQRYQNRSIEAAQVMEELVEMARKFREAAARGEQLGLSEDEVRFYDALANDESAVLELTDETLKKIAHELAENLRKNLTVDWSARESVQARLRLMVKRILRKYKYPPDQQDAAVELVLQQAKALGEGWASRPTSLR
jgi:type I site-specific restriction-modification system R (restriction) subunit